jgi:hypothetical protein
VVWGFYLAVDLVYARILILAMIWFMICNFLKCTFILCWLLWVAVYDIGDALA